mgnify:CR=1 FL=1
MALEPIWENEDAGTDFEKDLWDEADWERFIHEQDRKSEELSRLADLFLNSGMDPEQDLELLFGDDRDQCSECRDHRCRWEVGESVQEPEPVHETEFERAERDFHDIPAYRLAHEFAIQSMELLKGIGEETFRAESAFHELTSNCCLAGAKIAGGHGLGYRPDSIYGNVVKCKQAASALAESIVALDVLCSREDVGEESIRLRQLAQHALRELRIRIEELRAEARRLHGSTNT